MRILITILLLFVTLIVTQAQVPTSFRGTLNIYQSSGTSPNFEIRGIFNDTQGQYTSDSVEVGDVIYLLDGANCVSLTVTNVISSTGGVIRVDVTENDASLASAPLGNAAIMEVTPNNSFPTYIDGISADLLSCIQTHFAILVDELISSTGNGNSSVPGNSQDTIVQTAHGFSVLDPVFVNASGNWILANISDEDSIHMGIITEVISTDTAIITFSGITTQVAHGYTVGSVYFVQDNGTFATTVPDQLINDIAFYVISDDKLFITEQRPVLPSTDLNGIYSGSDTIPDGTIARGINYIFKGLGADQDNYYITVNQDNTNTSMRGDSVTISLNETGGIITDQNATKEGLKYAAAGYVTNPRSLADKAYVDAAAAAASVADGDKGDITVSSSGAAWNIDSGVVGPTELENTAVTPASYGTATNIPSVTFDADGRATTASNNEVSLARQFYVSSTGNDSNSGRNPSSAWQTVSRVNTETLQAGDIVNFKGGETFSGTSLNITESGTLTAPIVFTSYGGGTATISMSSGTQAIALTDVDYITIDNLNTTNTGTTEYGILINPTTGSDMTGITIKNSKSSGFVKQGLLGYSNSALYGITYLLIEDCEFYNNGDGIFIYPSLGAINATKRNSNITIRRVKAYNNKGNTALTTSHSGSGIVLAGATSSTIEYCEAFGNGANNSWSSGGPFGIWIWECNGVTIQYCESHHNVTGASPNNQDGGGFDIDGGCANSVIQYCYSHDNSGPGFALYQFSGGATFTTNTIRYNISQNDARGGDGALSFYTPSANANAQYIHNNVFFVDGKSLIARKPYTISFLTGSAAFSAVEVRNNIFYAKDTTASIAYEGVAAFGTWSNNYYHTDNGANANYSSGGTVGDPKLRNPGGAITIGLKNFPSSAYLDAYKLIPNSPCINAGATIATPTLDFFNTTAPLSTRDIGIAEYSAIGADSLNTLDPEPTFTDRNGIYDATTTPTILDSQNKVYRDSTKGVFAIGTFNSFPEYDYYSTGNGLILSPDYYGEIMLKLNRSSLHMDGNQATLRANGGSDRQQIRVSAIPYATDNAFFNSTLYTNNTAGYSIRLDSLGFGFSPNSLFSAGNYYRLPVTVPSAGQSMVFDANGTGTWTTVSTSVSDGDKGDITVSSSGTVWNIDADAVGSNEIATDAVGASEIATSAVTTTEILDGTIQTSDLAFTPVTGSGTSTRIAYWSGTSALTSSSNLYWDNSNGRIGVGTSSPSYALHVNGTNAGAFGGYFKNTSTGVGAATNIILENDVASRQGQIFKAGTTYGTYKTITNNDMGIYNSPSAGNMSFLNDFASGNINFAAGGASTPQLKLTTTEFSNSLYTILGGATSSTSLFTGYSTLGNNSLELNTGQAVSNDTKFATLAFITNQSGLNNAIGSTYFANSNLGTAEKRLAYYSAVTDGATNSGAFVMGTSNAGTLAERMRITKSGSVGIGTNAPAQKLHVQENANGATAVRIENTTAGTASEAALALAIDAGKYAAFELFSGSFSTAGLQNSAVFTSSSGVTGGLKFATLSAANPIRFYTNSDGTTNERMIISGAGLVGIGNGSPTYKLDVSSSAFASARFASTDAVYGRVLIEHPSNTGFGLYMGSTPKYSIAAYNASGTLANADFTIYNEMLANNAILIDGANNNFGINFPYPVVSLPGAMLNVRGAGTTSSTNTALFEKSDGTDIVQIRDDGKVGIGTASTATSTLSLAATTTTVSSINIPEGTKPTSSVVGDMWNSSATNAMEYSGSGLDQKFVGCAFTGTADQTASNTASETSITPSGVGTLTIPANFLVAGKTLRIKAGGKYSTDGAVGPDLNLKIKLGSTIIAEFGDAEMTVGATDVAWVAEFNITCRTTGASGTVIDRNSAIMTYGPSGSQRVWLSGNSATRTIDTTASGSLTIVAQWSSADTDNSITTQIFTVEIL